MIGTQGFYLDVTPTNEARQESISQALIEIADNRASIEQAKGVLMYIYGIGPDAAFDLLRWRSQEGNVKLRALAEQVLADVLTLKHDKGAPITPDIRRAVPDSPRTRGGHEHLSVTQRALAEQLKTGHERI